MSLSEGLSQLQTNQSRGFFSSIADGAASVAANTRSRVEGLGILGNSDTTTTSPTSEWFGLTMFQRWVGGIGFAATAVFCFMMAIMALPLIVFSPSKFAVAFSLGNMMAILSIALFNGPRSHFKNMFSRERMIFSGVYFLSISLTLWSSVFINSYILTLIFSAVQVLALIKYITSFFPGGASGVRNTLSSASRMNSILPF
ncbi:hypothetical protein BB560_004356 [Smittium megazygosporum]|uniref:Protein transport protein SFT2 n=1 Tax=Smittium megazygosporum TaxID=133381 RepID=A0A2T9Z9F9_9FUNG|nr:hypothetical protein BB560_004356 [Smittium megazygosporum]